MKRLGTILLACALILGMSQCKKENTNTNAEGEPVHIVLKVDNDGQRCNLDPTSGEYTYTHGDKLLVGYNGKKAGELTYFSDDEEFRGDITIEPYVTGQNLHFYYLNGESYTPNADGECTVDISDQRDGLPVLAYGVSNETFPSDTYSAHLQNKCALVKFELVDLNEGPGTYMDIVVTGMQNLMKINFQNNSISSDKFKATEVDYSNMRYTNGEIHLYHQTESVKWAILLPQDPVEDADYWVGYDIGPWLLNGYESFGVSLPQITPNASISQDLYQQNLKLEYDSYIISEQTDPSSVHYFTVNTGNKKVQFSQGNLQYDYSSNKWCFAEHQWDVLETNGAINVVNGLWMNSDGVSRPIIDLFGWSTWGVCSNGTDLNAPHTVGYMQTNFVEFNANTELDNYKNWYTLSSPEWNYLISTRSGVTIGETDNARYVKASLDTDGDGNGNVHGIILFSDDYAHPGNVAVPSGINVASTTWDSNIYNRSEWRRMAAAGAVFLPAAGYRDSAKVDNVNVGCYYWSLTPTPRSIYSGEWAYRMLCTESDVNVTFNPKTTGCSVRLVRDME